MTTSPTKTTTKTKTVKTFAAACAALTALTGLAITPANASDIKFRFHTYELKSEAGAKVVYKRLTNRVENHCYSGGPRFLSGTIGADKCIDSAMNDLVAKIDHPRLTQIHALQG